MVQKRPEVARLHLFAAPPNHVLAAAALTGGLITLRIQGTAHITVTGTAAQQVMAQAPVARQTAVTAMSGHQTLAETGSTTGVTRGAPRHCAP